MHDDERRLGERLKRYEARIPIDREPPVLGRPSRFPRWALAGAGAALLGVAVLAANPITDPRIGSASPTPSSTGSTPDPSSGTPSHGVITSVELRNTGRRLFVVFGGLMESCTDYEADVEVADDILDVLVTPTEEEISCRLRMEERTLTVELDAPFTGRAVRDASTGTLFPVAVAGATASPTSAPSLEASPPAPSGGGTASQVAWAQSNLPVHEGGVSTVVAEDGRYFALGGTSDPVIWESSDGVTWTEHVLPWHARTSREPEDLPRLSVARMAMIDGRFVAVGHYRQGGGDYLEPVTWTSPDGRSWTPVEDDSFREAFSIIDLTAGPAGLVAATHEYAPGEGSAWSSPDGLRWSEVRPEAGSIEVNAAVGTSRRYLLAGATGLDTTHPRIWASVDARTWEPLALEGSDSSGRVTGLSINANGTWAAIGFLEGSPAAWVSRDGVAWEVAQGFSPAVEEYRDSMTVAGSGESFIAIIGACGAFAEDTPCEAWVTPDGFTWQRASASLPQVEVGRPVLEPGAAIVGNRLVVVGTAWVPRDDVPDLDTPGGWFAWSATIEQ